MSRFSVKNFLSHSTETFRRGKLLCSVTENLWIRGRGKYQYFHSKIFRLTVPKKFIGEPFSVSLFSGIEKFYASEGYVTIFRRKFFVSQFPNIS